MSQEAVEIAEIRRFAEILLDHVEEIHGPEVDLDKDYFWSVPQEDLYDVLKDPEDLTIGQLTENVDNLRNLLEDPDDALAFKLVWLGDLLKAIGHSVAG